MTLRADAASYEKMEVLGFDAIRTGSRLIRDSIPEGLYAYDLKTDDVGNICEISPKVDKNHYGTILCREPLPLKNGSLKIRTDQPDYHFLCENASLQEFMDGSEAETEEMEMCM